MWTATSRRACVALALLPAAAGAASVTAREASSPAVCQSAGAHAPITGLQAALQSDPSVRAYAALAEAWSDAGCFIEALQVLQRAKAAHPVSQELDTRLRVARSLVREENFFEDLDRANSAARLKRDVFRCTTLSDLDACREASQMDPGNGAVAVKLHAAEAAQPAPRAADAAPGPGLAAAPATAAPAAAPEPAAANPSAAAVAPLSARRSDVRYSNAAPETQSH